LTGCNFLFKQPVGGIVPVVLLACFAFAAMSGVLALTPMPWMSVGVVAGIVIFLVMIRYPEPFFLLIVVLIPMDNWRGVSEHFPMLTVSKILGIPLMAAVLIRIFFHRNERSAIANRRWTALALFVVVWAVATIQSPWKAESLNNMRQLAQSICFMIITAWCASRAGGLRRITLAVAGSSFIASLVAIAGSFLHIPWLMVNLGGIDNPAALRAIGTGNDPNIFAASVLFSLPFSVAWAFRSRGIMQVFWVVSAGINCAAVMLTFSRSIILMLFGTLLILGFEYRRRLPLRYLPILMPLLIVVAFFGVPRLMGSGPLQRLTTLTEFSSDRSLMRRSCYIGVAVSAVAERPLFGWGPGVFDKLYGRSQWAAAYAVDANDFFRRAHNMFLEIVVGSGLIGLMIFLIGCALALQRLLEKSDINDQELLRAMGFGFIILLISFCTLSEVYHKYLWLAMGIGFVMGKRSQQPGEPV
jgi:putative inorganic carbon (HCO3(-)) transporter